MLRFSRLWYGELDAISNAIGYAKFFSRSHDAVIRVYDETGNVIETHERGRVQRVVSWAFFIEQVWLAAAGSRSYRMNHAFLLPGALRE